MIEYKPLVPAIIEAWNKYHRRPAVMYKLLVTDPWDGRCRMFCANGKRAVLHAWIVETHNMSRTAINSKPGNHVLDLMISLRDEALLSAKLKPAKPADVDLYSLLWPIKKSLLQPR